MNTLSNLGTSFDPYRKEFQTKVRDLRIAVSSSERLAQAAISIDHTKVCLSVEHATGHERTVCRGCGSLSVLRNDPPAEDV